MQYIRYFIVGSTVGLSAVVIRELLATLGQDTAAYYSLTVMITYIIGICSSFLLHRRFTFWETLQENGQRFNFCFFSIIAVVGMFLTTWLSLFYRYGLGLGPLLGRYAGAGAFILAAVSASAITYFLNKRYSLR